MKSLHPRNRHNQGYDFPALIAAEPSLGAYVMAVSSKTSSKTPSKTASGAPSGDGLSIDFADPSAVKALNSALLLQEYGVRHWDIPDGALCPPIPGRVDYVHYMADLLGVGDQPNSAIRMLDIGTGANGIYPLLAASVYDWQCVGSDISQASLDNVAAILKHNPAIQSRCELRFQPDKHSMFANVIQPGEHFDISVCNPPFHASPEAARSGSMRKTAALARSRSERAGGGQMQNDQMKSDSPTLNFGGMENELWCNGGEALFLKKMIKESKQFAQQVTWFTSLVSKGENLKPLKKVATKVGATDIRVIDMIQGKKQTRVLAWTFR